MDRLTSITVFVRVVETGGFSAAAKRTNLSPTMVSNHVQALENHLGVRLLNRTTRKVSLTEIGKAYYERCIQILGDIDEADRIANSLSSTPRGTLRLNLSPGLAGLLAPICLDYIKRYPESAIDMLASDRMVDLVDEGFDLAVRMTPPPESSMIVRRLASYRHVICAAPGYLAKRGTPERPEDLARHNCLHYAYNPFGDNWQFDGPEGAQTVRVTGTLRTNSAETLRTAALNGQGIVLIPKFMVADDLAARRLVAVLDGTIAAELSIDAVYAHREYLAAKIRAFLDLLIECFRRADYLL